MALVRVGVGGFGEGWWYLPFCSGGMAWKVSLAEPPPLQFPLTFPQTPMTTRRA